MLKTWRHCYVGGARNLDLLRKDQNYTAQELGAVAAKAAIERAGVDVEHFDHAVFGNAQQTWATRCMERGMWARVVRSKHRR